MESKYNNYWDEHTLDFVGRPSHSQPSSPKTTRAYVENKLKIEDMSEDQQEDFEYFMQVEKQQRRSNSGELMH